MTTLTVKQTAILIASIAKTGVKLDAQIQEAGLAALYHTSQNSEASLLDKLFNALPKGARKLAFVEWVLAHGQVRTLSAQNKSDKAMLQAGCTFRFDAEKVLDLESATATVWTNFKPEASVSTAYDIQHAAKGVFKRAQEAVQQGKALKGADLALSDLKALVAFLEEQQVTTSEV